jgi:hypothetical protein
MGLLRKTFIQKVTRLEPPSNGTTQSV